MTQPTDHATAAWRKDMGRCVLNNTGECLANVPQACLCAQMPPVLRRHLSAPQAVGASGVAGTAESPRTAPRAF